MISRLTAPPAARWLIRAGPRAAEAEGHEKNRISDAKNVRSHKVPFESGRTTMISMKIFSSRLASLIFGTIIFVAQSWAQSQAFPEWKEKVATHFRTHVHVHVRAGDSRTGEALVAFTLDRSGKITSTELKKSTGFAELDAAVVQAVENAQPFPPPPAEVDDSQLKFAAPFVFNRDASSTAVDIVTDEKLKAKLRGICRGC
jgi:protein TonB